MLIPEAKWLHKEIYSRPIETVFPMINIGSSTQDFRVSVQPWIDDLVFRSSRELGQRVYHVDLKPDKGVDYNGNIMENDFRDQLRKLNAKSVLCSNVLEHVPDHTEFASALSQIVESGSLLFITVPFQYPYHPDPIDTLYRPSPHDLLKSFPSFEVQTSKILSCGIYLTRASSRPLRAGTLRLIRLACPFLRFSQWKLQISQSAWLFRQISATCAVLRKK